MQRAQLEHLIRAAGAVTGSRRLVVIGSQAILGEHPFDAPPEALRSREADLIPIDAPETVPGNPMVELFRDRIGVRVLFQGRYVPGRTDAFVRLVEAVVRAAADDPEATLGALRERLHDEATAFLG